MIRKYVKKYDGPFERKPAKPRKRRRKKDNRTKRESPSQREGIRYKSVAVREDTYIRLHELGRFYRKSLARIIAEAIVPAFDKAYQESLTLSRIEVNREKERERVAEQKRALRQRQGIRDDDADETDDDEDDSFDDSPPPRRTHF